MVMVGRKITQNGQWLCKSLALVVAPTPRSPLPVSVGPAHHHYYFSSSPSPPFSPPSSPHADILSATSPAASPSSFSLDHKFKPHHKLHSRCSSCLLHLLKWFLQRCCISYSTRKRCHRVTDVNNCRKTMTTLEKMLSHTDPAGDSARMAL